MNLKAWLVGDFSIGRWVRSLVLIYVVVGLYVFFNADRMIFLPPPSSYRDSPEIIQLNSSGNLISALHLPQPQARYTLLYSHGNAEDLGQIRPVLELLRSAGLNVFAYDYRGYGTSQGSPSEAGSYQDITAAYHYLTQNLAVPAERIVLLGRSVGSGPSVYLATQQPVGGLILENAFTSIFRVVVPFPLLPFDKFPNLSRLRQVRAAILIIHAQLDSIIPLWHGKALYAAANPPKQSWWVPGAEHNDLVLVAGQDYPERIGKFVEAIAP